MATTVSKPWRSWWPSPSDNRGSLQMLRHPRPVLNPAIHSYYGQHKINKVMHIHYKMQTVPRVGANTIEESTLGTLGFQLD